jgi:hypothetical protein
MRLLNPARQKAYNKEVHHSARASSWSLLFLHATQVWTARGHLCFGEAGI